MRQLTKTESRVMALGGLAMVIGSIAMVLLQPWAAYVFGIGALLFVAMQLRQRYEGRNPAVRRLRRMVIISDVLLLACALLMLANSGNFLHLDQWLYAKYVHNNWVVALLVAAILQLYTSSRISAELEKEAKKL
ncbi:MAG: hypothetical protein IJ710_10010 [Prevotella sp.]|nr:hypothetical protein [Prevotella sp.]